MGCCGKKLHSAYESYTELVVRRTCLLLVVWIVVPLFLVGIGLIAGGGLPSIETDLSSGDYLRTDGVVSDRHDSLRAAVEFETERTTSSNVIRRLYQAANFSEDSHYDSFQEYDEFEAERGMQSSSSRRLSTYPERMFAEFKIDIYYEAKGGYAFDPKVISDIRKIELGISSLPGFKKICLAKTADDNTCREHISAMRFFYGRALKPGVQEAPDKSRNPFVATYLFPDGAQAERNDIGAVLSAMSEPSPWRKLSGQHGRLWYFDGDFPNSRIMRSRVWFGTPFTGFRNRNDKKEDQRSIYNKFISNELFPFLDKANTGNVKVYFEGDEIGALQVRQAVSQDALLAGAALFLVWMYMTIYTRAPLLALLGMTTVILSIPVGTLFFCMFGHSTFPVINFLALFLLTGIGADHLFVLTDCWRQAKQEGRSELERLKAMLAQAGKAVGACGITTAVSFLANLFSAVRPVRWFGIYVGLCVISNLILCLGIFPLVLLLLERWKPDQARDIPQPGSVVVVQAANSWQAADDELGPSKVEIVEPSRCGRILQSYTTCLKKGRFLVVGLTLLVTFGGLVLLTQNLEVSRDPPAFFKLGEHNLVDAPDKAKRFGNTSAWTADMEWQSLNLCLGCQWSDNPADGFMPTKCQRIGRMCSTLPCKSDIPGAADPYPCAGRGQCGAGGRCACNPGFSGRDCREIAGASKADCGASLNEAACSGHGICHRGYCWCNVGFLGDRCDRREVGVRDCQWTGFGKWSDCSQSCDDGQQFRTRSISQPAGPSGMQCQGSAMETKACNLKKCDVNCTFSDWGPWGTCNADCGSGMQERKRTVAVQARNQGLSCQGDSAELKICSSAPCGPACTVGAWTPKNGGACSKTCGGGVKTEERTVQRSATATPQDKCPTDTTRSIPCNTDACPVVCAYSDWQADGDCNVQCGTGEQKQTRTVTMGTGCALPLSRMVACVIPCPTEPPICNDASYTEWGEWGACSAACGPAEQTRSRSVKQGFFACNLLKQTEEVRTCTTPACPKSCGSYPWVATGECNAQCGAGKRPESRDFGGNTPPSGCPATRMADCASSVPCPTNCVLGDWAPTKPCSAQCGAGQQEEVRIVHQNGANGGQTCPSLLERTRSVSCTGTNCPTPAPAGSPTPAPTPPPTTPPPTPAPKPPPGVPPAPTPPPPTPAPPTKAPDPPAPSTTRFQLKLHGNSGLSSAQKTALIAAIAKILGLSVGSVTVQGRRLQEHARRLNDLTVYVDIPQAFQARLQDLEAAVSSGTLSSTLQSSGFYDLTYIGYTKGSTSIVEVTPAPTPAPISPPISPTAATPTKVVRVLGDNQVAHVNVVMGLQEEPPSMGSDLGEPVWDTDFVFSRKSTQMAIADICKEAVLRRSQLATRKAACFVDDFDVYLKSKGLPGYPVSPSATQSVDRHFNAFLYDVYGKDYRGSAGFTADGNRVRFIKFKFVTDLPQDMPASDATKWAANWDKFIEEMNRKYRGSGTGVMFHTSALWIRVETEERLISSTLMCAGVSVIFAFGATGIFLWNLALAVYLILGIVSVIICLAATMFGVMQWTFGAVEAVGLIVFVGFSVDYSLHMAESYSQSKEKHRFAKVLDAMLRTGGAVFAAAITSALAGLPILFCTIQVFVKFGMVIVINTFLSLFFSLCFLVALLMIIGPVDNFGSCEVLCDLLRGRKPKQLDSNDSTPRGDNPVVGHIVGGGAGAGDDYRWGGDDPSSGSGGYKWDTGEDDKDDPKKPQKGAPPSGSAASSDMSGSTTISIDGQGSSEPSSGAAAAASTDEDNANPELSVNPVLQEPTRVSTPTRGQPPKDDELVAQTMGRSEYSSV